MSQAFEIAIIRRAGAISEPEIHVKSDVLIKEAWLYMPNYMPAGIRVKQDEQYKAELILPKGAFFQAITEDVELLIKNWHSGIVLVEMDSCKMYMDMYIYTSDVLTNRVFSQQFVGGMSYLCAPVVVGQMARVVMDERRM